MKIILLSDDSIRLEPATGQLTIEAESANQEYSPYQMFASGLAVCTFGVLQSWGSNVGLSADDLVIDVSWSFEERPHRVSSIALSYDWPSLPADRAKVAQRVAELCPLHQTLKHSPHVTIQRSATTAAAA
ncbi:MAG TPA: OsmC family protein [Gemmatimonadaceae bacterium]|nr:OsmC family protein [Gemmatimonadaceae bacterium]